MAISTDNIRRKRADASCVKQSGTLKYVVHILGGTVSNKYRHHHYYDTSRYVVYVLGEAVSKTYRCLPESRNYQHVEHYRGLKLPPRRQLEMFAQRFDNCRYTVVVVVMSFQGQVNPQVGHEIPGAEEGPDDPVDTNTTPADSEKCCESDTNPTYATDS